MRTATRRRLVGAVVGLMACALAFVPAAWVPTASAQLGGTPVLDAPSAHKLPSAGGVLIDIRTPSELAATGKPAGATTVPLQDDERRFRGSFADEVARAAGGDKARPVALIDANGGRSQYAARLLAAQGFSQVFVVGEGMVGSNFGPGWLARGLPVEK
jgi:rhodanese-related sulfurtransferase